MAAHSTLVPPRWLAAVAGIAGIAGLTLAAPAAAQTGLATVTGIVSDKSGGAVPGVTVSVTSQATNIAYTGVTNDAGNYIVTSVPIGTYVVSVELQGFKSVQSTVALSVSQTARVDFALEVGAVEERIEVIATGAVLQTENAVVGSKFEREQVEKLPVKGRSLSAIALYTAGTTQPNAAAFDGLRGTGRPFVNGQREQGNNFTVDGVDSNGAIDNNIAYQPSPDAVEQVSVETNNYSPEMGNVAGAVVNMVIKSGTNQFSGTGFSYWRDNALAATPWTVNRQGGRKSDYNRNVFGGTFGGPLIRNQLFFFGDYQGGRAETPPADGFVTVIPDAWRNGDLSSLLASGIQLRDPASGAPFANNQIPVSRFSPFARALLANENLYPRANVNRPLSDFRDNYRGTTASREETDQFDIKVDLNASARDKLYVRYSRQWAESRPEQVVMPLQFVSVSTNPNWSTAVNWNRIFGTAVVNDLLVGYNNNAGNTDFIDINGLGFVNDQLGIGGGDQAIAGMSEVRMGNTLTNIGNLAIGSNTHNRVYQLNERLTWVRSRHTLKFGVQWNYYQMERYYAGNNGMNGFISYTDFNFTGAPAANFLLDQVTSKGRGSLAPPWTQLQHRVAVYAADDFKATDRLTLNYGLRWAFTSPMVEQDDRQANFDLTNATPLLAGQDGHSRALYDAYDKGWEPRLGFAYRHGDRWVFRGGYGITQYMEGTGANLRLPLNPPFFFESQVAYDSTSGASTIATGFQGLQALDRPSGQVRAWDPALRPQFTQQWNLFTEYLLGARSSLSVGYVGNHSKHLVTPVDGNQPLPGTGDPSTWLPVQQRRPLYPFNPLITSISTTASRGRGNYNALQTTFKQRLWQGLDFVGNYTYSKTMSNNRGYYGSGSVAAEGAYPMNSYDIEGNYGPAFFDATHIASVAGNYDLPFGRERTFGTSWHRAVDAIAGGWALSFAVTAHTGYPITVTDSSNPSLQASRSPERPDRIASGEVDDPTLARWIDRAAFVSAPRGRFGDSGVGILRMPGYWNLDLSISKRFATIGRQYAMVRGELFNALNHPNFGPPVADIQNQNFGTITSTIGEARVVQFVLKYFF